MAPIDKTSLALTIVLAAAVLLHEPISVKVALGVALMLVAGALLTLA